MSGHICGDNRFELIEKYKQKLINSTNIETSKGEMAVIDSFLFRCWQMGWLDAAEKQIPKKPIVDIKDRDFVLCPSCSGSVYTGNVIEAIHNRETTYCEHCGQALDWSETK